MKNISKLIVAVLSMAFVTCADRVRAADGSWINDQDDNWSTLAAWLNGIVADGAGSTAFFTNDNTPFTTLYRTVTLDSPRTIGNLTFADADALTTPTGWILAGDTLTLSNSAATPVITVNPIDAIDSTNDVRINSVLTGGQGFIKQGAGTLTLNAANTMGSVRIDEGLIGIGNASALGTGNRAVTFNGGGVRVWNGGPGFSNTNIVATVGTIVSSNGNYDAYNGPWSGSGTMLIHSTGRFTPGGGSAGTFLNFNGTIDLTDSTTGNETRVNLGGGAVYDMSTVTLNTGTNAGRFTFRNTVPATVRIGALIGGPGSRLQTSEQAGGTLLVWEIGHLNTSTLFAGNMQHRNNVAERVGALTKVGTGTLTLTGTNTFVGPTSVTNGVLALAEFGSLSNSISINVHSGGTFDVSGLSTVWSLGITQTLAGSGIITGNVAAASGLISPGSTVTPVATLSFSNNLSLTEGVTNAFDITGPGVNDTILVAGDLEMTSLVEGIVVRVRPTGAFIPNGTYTLFKWGGNLTSAALLLDPPVQTGTLTLVTNLASKEIALQVTGVAAAASLTWRGDGIANEWDLTTANWLNGAIPSVFNGGDNVTFNDFGSNNVPVSITVDVGPGSIVVNSTNTYTFNSFTGNKITGSGGLFKTNTGTLIINTENDYVGNTTVAAGTLQIGSFFGIGAIGTGILTNNGTVIFARGNDSTFVSSIYGSGTLIQSGGDTLTLSANNPYSGNTVISNGTVRANTSGSVGSGTIVLAGGTFNPQAQINNPIHLADNGTLLATLEIPVANTLSGTAGALSLNNSAGNGFRFVQTNSFTFDRPIDLQSGARTVAFYNIGSTQTYMGVISGPGGLHRRAPSAGFANDAVGGHTVFAGDNTYFGGTTLSEGNVGIASSSVVDIDGITILSGPFGVGTIAYSPPAAVAPPFGYAALYAVGGPRTVANPITFNAVAADLVEEALTLNGIHDLTFSGPVSLNAVHGIRVNNTGANVFSGPISGFGSLVKTGNGTLTLSGENSYNGDTTVAAGKLLVQNTSGFGTGFGILTVNSGATLGGTGTIIGVVTNNGTLSPGTSIGTLTINGTLVLNSGSTTEMELNAATGTNDQVAGLTGVTYGGTLQLNNLAGTLTNGATFQLFNSAAYDGAFAAINPPTPGPGQTWNTSNLAVNGTISVVGNPVQQPTISNVTVLGNGNVEFSFTGSAGQAYRIWATTNVASTPIIGTWTLLTNTTFSGGLDTFTDAQAASFLQRFYVITVP